MIYRLILPQGDFKFSLSPPPIPLLRTNMQIRDEALAIYYVNNKFELALRVGAG